MFLNKHKIYNMKRINKNKRDKAFWGALIGAGIGALTNLIGGSIQAKRQEHIAEMQYNQQKQLLERQDIQNEYNQKLQNQIAEQENDGIYDELRRKNYKCGGKIKKRKKAEFGLNDIGQIGSSLISGIGSLGSSMIATNTQNNLTSLQMKLAEDKFNSQANKFQSYTGGDASKNLRSYIDGTENDAGLVDSRKQLFRNSRMYLS